LWLALSIFKEHNHQKEIIFAEIPLLFEAGFDKYFDFYVTTFCSEDTRLKRAMTRESYNFSAYTKIAQIQLSQKIKVEKADFAINTDINLADVGKQITQLIGILSCID